MGKAFLLTARAVLIGVIVTASARALAAQVGSVPVRVQLSAPTREVARGASVPIRATLKNLRDQNVTAPDDVPVTLIWPATGKRARLVIPRGQASAELTVTLAGVGLTKMEAEAPQLPPAFLLLVVRPDGTASQSSQNGASGGSSPTTLTTPPGRPSVTGSGGAAATPSAVLPPPPPPPSPAAEAQTPQAPVSTDATGQSGRLDLQVVPDDVDPAGSTWTAAIGVGLVGPRGEPLSATEDLPVRFTARFGRITPASTVIRRGKIATTDEVTVVADRPGTDLIAALSPLGSVERQVRFNAPVPSKIRLEANPRDVVDDGRSAVVVTVMLLDSDNHPTQTTDSDLCTTLATSLGELQDRKVCIPRGDFFKETTLTSARHGVAQIVASGIALADGQATARFLFPWLMVALATIGGVLGGFVRSGRQWTKHLVHNLAVAAIVGVVFYVLAFFGAIGAIRKLPVEVGRIAAINELGAFVLGFIGSYYQPLLAGSVQPRRPRARPTAAANAN